MSSRRLLVLVRHLPEESVTKRAMAQDPWPLMTHLLVTVVNEQRLARADYAAAHGERTKPTLIPRPGETSAAQDRAQVRDIHDALLSMTAPVPELDDARARLVRPQPHAPLVEID